MKGRSGWSHSGRVRYPKSRHASASRDQKVRTETTTTKRKRKRKRRCCRESAMLARGWGGGKRGGLEVVVDKLWPGFLNEGEKERGVWGQEIR